MEIIETFGPWENYSKFVPIFPFSSSDYGDSVREPFADDYEGMFTR